MKSNNKIIGYQEAKDITEKITSILIQDSTFGINNSFQNIQIAYSLFKNQNGFISINNNRPGLGLIQESYCIYRDGTITLPDPKYHYPYSSEDKKNPALKKCSESLEENVNQIAKFLKEKNYKNIKSAKEGRIFYKKILSSK